MESSALQCGCYCPLIECLLISSLRRCISKAARSCSSAALALDRASSSAAASQTERQTIISIHSQSSY